MQRALKLILVTALMSCLLCGAAYAASPPWVVYYREVEAMFKDDQDIVLEYDETENEILMYVEDPVKADAISQLLPEEKAFGNVVLKTTVIPANEMAESKAALIAKAFEGNPVLEHIYTVSGVMTNDMNYIVFKNKVVQFYSDNLGDANGLTSTLYQDIARELFGDGDGVFYCTEPGTE